MDTEPRSHPAPSAPGPQPAPTGSGPDLDGYRAIHDTIRTSNDRLVAAIDALPATTPDLTTARALQRWFTGYRDELHGHHQVEDELFFPALAQRVPAFADYVATLDADHARTDELLAAVTAGLDRLTSSRPWDESRAGALGAAAELRDLLNDHLDVEDRDILPMFERHFDAEEYERLDQAALKSVAVRQALFTVPWFMATASPDAAARTLERAPLALKVVHRLTRRRYARLEQSAFGPAATSPSSASSDRGRS